jgi:hypothetical protein
MRARFALALVSVIASIAVASCGEGGTGVGTAPPESGKCPDKVPATTDGCNALQVCNYGLDGVPLAAQQQCTPTNCIVAVCSSAGTKWEVQQAGDGGTFADAVVPEVAVDGAAESGDATDDASDTASDAIDGATDALDDAIDATDAVNDATPDAASDGG